MKKIILSILAATALASCLKSEVHTPEEGGLQEVVFTSYISTRATGTLWDEGDEIGVFMYESEAASPYGDGSNVLYTTSGGSDAIFTSLYPLLYPAEGVEVDFIAYHPYSADISNDIITLNTANQSTKAKVKAQDFMVASAQVCSETNAPALSFTRKMSRVVISVNRKDSRADAVLSDISVSSLKVDGTFTLSNTSDAGRENAAVETDTTSSDISLFFDDESSIIEAIIIPQTTSSSIFNLTIDGELEFTTAILGSFEEGKQYNYNLSVGGYDVEFTAGTITEWEPVEAGDMEAGQLFSYVEFKRNESSSAYMTKVDETGAIESGDYFDMVPTETEYIAQFSDN